MYVQESLDEVGRFLVEYADKAVEAHGQQAKDALFVSSSKTTALENPGLWIRIHFCRSEACFIFRSS